MTLMILLLLVNNKLSPIEELYDVLLGTIVNIGL
jgi:hypothetical protein